MNLNLFPTSCGIWDVGTTQESDTALYDALLNINRGFHLGEQIWDRVSHNIFDGSVPEATELSCKVLPLLQEMIGENAEVTHLQGREVVRRSGVEIQPHNDEDECHMQAVYFPNGPELDKSASLIEQVNQFDENCFAICNPNWRASGFAGYTMPWEQPSKFWVKPHRGLLVAFDARAIHFHKPYNGSGLFMQVLFNITLRKTQNGKTQNHLSRAYNGQ